MKVAIYTRVSTNKQNHQRQINDLTDLCTNQNWQVVEIFKETISGAKSNIQRPQLQRLFELATTHQIKKVIISEVSRLGRNLSESIKTIDQLTAAGVSIYIQNIGMETLLPNGKVNFMFKPILVTLAGFAEMERELLRERIQSGLERAKKQGKTLGRPKGKKESTSDLLSKYPKVKRELKSGLSLRKISKITGVSINTIQKVKAAALKAA